MDIHYKYKSLKHSAEREKERNREIGIHNERGKVNLELDFLSNIIRPKWRKRIESN